jgi:membrane protein
MMAVVPAIAIGFYLTDGLGMRDLFVHVIQSNLGDARIVGTLIKAADNIVNTAESGLFGFVSMFTFVWIVISLMITVRSVFNNVWKVERDPNFFKMIGMVIGITILAPFVVIIFFSGSVVYSHVLDILFPQKLFFSDHLKSFASWLMFTGIIVLILDVMYKYIPGTRVHQKHALKSALISGIVFAGVQYLYLETQVMVAKQSAIYGVLAALPLFMIWLNLGWTIILYGAELSYAFQNVDRHRITIEKLDQLNAEAIRERKERLPNTITL